MTVSAAPMVPSPSVVLDVCRESADTVTLTLDASEHASQGFRPGQFNMLYAFGIGEVPISMSGSPGRPDCFVHTVRGLGAVTKALCGLKRGSFVGVRGPYGTPWPMQEARGKDLLIVAGGLGLAPLRPVVYELRSQRTHDRRVFLLVGSRSPQDLLFRGDLAEWQRDSDLRTLVTVDHAPPQWTGHVGVVPALLREVDLNPADTVAFVCGPEIMMRFAVRELGRLGVPDEHIYLSLERNMKCAIGLCGHCQFGASFVCKDGPVMRYDRIRALLTVREL